MCTYMWRVFLTNFVGDKYIAVIGIMNVRGRKKIAAVAYLLTRLLHIMTFSL